VNAQLAIDRPVRLDMFKLDQASKELGRCEEFREACPELMRASEVAQTLRVRGSNLQFIKDLPEPVQHLRATRVWRADEIRDFAEAYHARRRARSARPSGRAGDHQRAGRAAVTTSLARP
jgi:hypothetical protein